MQTPTYTAGQRLAYTFNTAKGIPIIFELSAFQPALLAIRRRSQELRQQADLAGLLNATKGCQPVVAPAEKPPADCSPWRIERMALATAAFERYLNVILFDSQLVAGLVLAAGGLAELATGEGKTFAAALCAVDRAVDGRGCHVLTANDYLAERDAAWLQPVYRVLGLSCAHVGPAMDVATRRQAYSADITYLTAREAVYDYLRDGLAESPADVRQRPLAAAIVDEADFLMIDQARSPLVIAGREQTGSRLLQRYDALAGQLVEGLHFSADRRNRRVALTLAGQALVAESLRLEGMHHPADVDHYARVHAALYARCLLVRDIDYLVRSGGVELVDSFTGRVAEGRRWPYGVQAAVEVREGLVAQAETGILGSLTLQRFFPLYPALSALTATAVSAAAEFNEVYGLPIYLIPPHIQSCRIDAPDRLYLTLAAKEAALIATAAAEHRRGRPVLLVTASVLESESLAVRLESLGIDCQVLNAKNDHAEAAAVARAGCRAVVTVSTEMAGRGVDIRLGGPQADPAEVEALAQLGGLCILVSSRRESRRHDDQLRGRAARQGEPGFTCFFTSLEDPLFARYGVRDFLSSDLRRQLESVNLQTLAAIDDQRALAEMDRAQRLIETQLHRIRSARLRSSQLLELQRRRITAWRLWVLHEDMADHKQHKLSAIDRFWQQHLDLAEELREGIHLARYGGRDPEREFDRRLDEIFLEALDQLEARLADPVLLKSCMDTTMPSPETGGSGATWTYQIDEDPLPAFSLPAVSGMADIAQALVQAPLFVLRALQQLLARVRRRSGRLMG